MRLRSAVVLCCVALAAVAGATAAVLRQSRDIDERITSVALGGPVRARVVLPAGYDDRPLRRYPVVYFLHGLPATATSYRGNRFLRIYAMLKPGISIEKAGADLALIAHRLAGEFPKTNETTGVSTRTFHDAFNGGKFPALVLTYKYTKDETALKTLKMR